MYQSQEMRDSFWAGWMNVQMRNFSENLEYFCLGLFMNPIMPENEVEYYS